ncbi:VPLPA-CTERM sorting domain-containing protein [Sulfitobacter sp. D35]|uniref:VPLPA-CTERM sorting domain-containing protein n=1 Tax=Sulfitobacter sp. D35 TaxID=3083252 RepID=UPI00296FEDC8|nr:VPLPA-CTERM sorting domain-containing protein [Sulfitobacter sp. D35]MDW4496777.1 VPLPA-CTERM sorting domain-containing protein [Sulfitobacter sp. D35]
MINLKIKTLVGAAAFAATAFIGGTASAAVFTYGFDGVTNNSVLDTSIAESQASVEVEDQGGTAVSFKFLNTAVLPMSIVQIYFADGSLLDFASAVITNSGTAFSPGSSPPNLPGGTFSADYATDADSNPGGKVNNGVKDAGDSVTVTFNYAGSSMIADVIKGLNDGTIDVGIHVQGFASGGSESLEITGRCDPITEICGPGVNVIPVPAGFPLLLTALAGVGILSRRKLRKTA